MGVNNKKPKKGTTAKAGPDRTQPNPPAPKKGTSRIPPPKKGSPRQADGTPTAKGITYNKYRQMLAAYIDHPSASHVAECCKVDAATAKKYIEQGSTKYGWKPIRARYDEIIKRAQDKDDKEWADKIADHKAIADAGKGVVKKYYRKLFADTKEGKARLEQVLLELKPKDVIAMADKLVRTDSFLHGGPDARIEVDMDKEAIKLANKYGFTVEEVKEVFKDIDLEEISIK